MASLLSLSAKLETDEGHQLGRLTLDAVSGCHNWTSVASLSLANWIL